MGGAFSKGSSVIFSLQEVAHTLYPEGRVTDEVEKEQAGEVTSRMALELAGPPQGCGRPACDMKSGCL
jgi:hypothetical protein